MKVALKKSRHNTIAVNQHFKGVINAEDFTANQFSISRKDGKLTITGSKVDENGVKHEVRVSFPETLDTSVIHLLELNREIQLTYSVFDELEPVLVYGDIGELAFITLDPGNTRVEGSFKDVQTRNDGNPVYTMAALFKLG